MRRVLIGKRRSGERLGNYEFYNSSCLYETTKKQACTEGVKSLKSK